MIDDDGDVDDFFLKKIVYASVRRIQSCESSTVIASPSIQSLEKPKNAIAAHLRSPPWQPQKKSFHRVYSFVKEAPVIHRPFAIK